MSCYPRLTGPAHAEFAALWCIGCAGLALFALVAKIWLSRAVHGDMKVSSLYVYPVKGMAGVSLSKARFDRLGFRWDRRFVVVDAKNHEFISQRKCPKMATLAAEVENAGEGDNKVTLRIAPRVLEKKGAGSRLEVAVDSKALAADSKNRVEINLWGKQVVALRVSREADGWLSDRLGIDCYLATITGVDEHVRPLKPKFQVGRQTAAFADGFPFLLISEESLAYINARLRKRGVGEVKMNRFRPNIVVSGSGEPFGEDRWAKISIGAKAGVSAPGGSAYAFRVAKPCARCTVPTVDQETGRRDKSNEPTRTLRKFRWFDWVKGGEYDVFVGQNLVHCEAQGTVRVGDRVQVLCGASGRGQQTSLFTKVMLGLARFV